MGTSDEHQGAARPLKLSFHTFRDFIVQYSDRISREGMFVDTERPFDIGTQVEFEVTLSDEFRLLRGSGEVVWRIDAGTSSDWTPGMAVRFDELDEPSERLIDRVVDKHTSEGGEPFSLVRWPAGTLPAGEPTGEVAEAPPVPTPPAVATPEPGAAGAPQVSKPKSGTFRDAPHADAPQADAPQADAPQADAIVPLDTPPAVRPPAGAEAGLSQKTETIVQGAADWLQSPERDPADTEATPEKLEEQSALSALGKTDETESLLADSVNAFDETLFNLDEPQLEGSTPGAPDLLASTLGEQAPVVAASPSSGGTADSPPPAAAPPALEIPDATPPQAAPPASAQTLPPPAGSGAEPDELPMPIPEPIEPASPPVPAAAPGPVAEARVPPQPATSEPATPPPSVPAATAPSPPVSEVPDPGLPASPPQSPLQPPPQSPSALEPLDPIQDPPPRDVEALDPGVPTSPSPPPPLEPAPSAPLLVPEAPGAAPGAPAEVGPSSFAGLEIDPLQHAAVKAELEPAARTVPSIAGAGKVAETPRRRLGWLVALLLVAAAAGAFLARDKITALWTELTGPAPPAIATAPAGSIDESPASVSKPGEPVEPAEPTEPSESATTEPPRAAGPGAAGGPADSVEPAPDGSIAADSATGPTGERGSDPGLGDSGAAAVGRSPSPSPPPPAAAAQPRFTVVERVSWRDRGSETLIVVRTNGSVDNDSFEILPVTSGAPRLLIKLFGVAVPLSPAVAEVGTAEVLRVRSGLHPGRELHLVVDLARSGVRVTGVEVADASLIVRLGQP